MTTPSPILRYFAHDHLPTELAEVSLQFAEVAQWVESYLPAGDEKSVALRKLLEAKDAAVRAAISDPLIAAPTPDDHLMNIVIAINKADYDAYLHAHHDLRNPWFVSVQNPNAIHGLRAKSVLGTPRATAHPDYDGVRAICLPALI